MSVPSRPSVSPQWATDSNYIAGSQDWSGLPNKVQPPTAIVGQGLTPENYFPTEIVNFELNNHGQWLTYLDAVSGGGLFGDGSDGTATFDGATIPAGVSSTIYSGVYYTLTRDVYYAEMTINPGISVNTNGFRVFVNDTLTVNAGVLHNNGYPASAYTGGGGAGYGSVAGGSSGASAIAIPSGGGVTSGSASTAVVNSIGGQGGQGGFGGAGGAVTQPAVAAGGIRNIFTMQNAVVIGNPTGAQVTSLHGGSGGGAGGGSSYTTTAPGYPGGGGGSAGILCVSVRNAIFTYGSGSAACLQAVGGVGGNASYTTGTGNPPPSASGGGGGGGGGILFVSYSVTLNSGGAISNYLSAAGGLGGVNIAGVRDGGTSSGNAGTILYSVLGQSGYSSTLPLVHNERGIATFATGGAGAGYDYVDVTFTAPYADTTFIPEVAIVGANDTDGLPGFSVRNLTTTGMRLRPDAQFNGSLRWKVSL